MKVPTQARENPPPDGSRTVRLTLPAPPSANRYWRVFRNRAVMSDEAREYKRLVAYLAQRAGLEPAAGEIVLTVRWYRARRSGDLSNRIKIVEDALRGVVYVDDKQVVELHAFRDDDKANPRVEIVATELPPREESHERKPRRRSHREPV